jgi:uncharacterized protein (DUF427 family)
MLAFGNNERQQMAKATWNGQVIAESDDTVIVEGNHYFPAHSVDRRFLVDSQSKTRCAWKGTAGYYDVVVDGEVNRDAAWYYPDPKPAASAIKDRVAFWRGVRIEA